MTTPAGVTLLTVPVPALETERLPAASKARAVGELNPEAKVLTEPVRGTVATCTALALLTELLVTVAVKLPTFRPLRPVTVSVVAVALVTLPFAPPLNVTVLPAAV